MTSRSVRLNTTKGKVRMRVNNINIIDLIVLTRHITINLLLWLLVFIVFIILLINTPYLLLTGRNDNYLYVRSLNGISNIIELIDQNNNDNSQRSIIYDRANKEPYLIRYYLLFVDRVNFPFNIFIHKFMKGDDDEDPHDHPWGFFHIILSSGYWENVPMNISEHKFDRGFCKIWRPAGYWNIVSSDYTHRIELRDGEPKPWTIFVPFKRNNHWGFWIKQNDTEPWVKQNNEDYLRNKDVTKKMD